MYVDELQLSRVIESNIRGLAFTQTPGFMDTCRGLFSFLHADWVFYARSWVGARFKYQKCAGKDCAFLKTESPFSTLKIIPFLVAAQKCV
jgi:hypothetical protein